MNAPAPAHPLPERTVSEQLAEFALVTSLNDIPEVVRIRAKHLILDAIGIAFASTRFPFAERSLAGINALGGAPENMVIGHERRLPLRDAMLMNGILVHGLDYDDTHVPGVIHATASAVPCVLGLGERLRSRGTDVLRAYILAVEAGARIAAAPKGGFHKVGFHPTGLVGAFGCSIAAGLLLDLPPEASAMAQGITLSMAGGSMEFLADGAWTKRMHPGWAAVSGTTAAYLAQNGFIGPTTAYEGRFGLFATHLDPRDAQPDASAVLTGLGQVWELDRVAVKPFPACHFVHGCADAALALVREHALAPDQVKSITALMPEETIPTVCEPTANKVRPVSDYDAKFSVQYTVAASIARGRFGLAELEDEARTDEQILSLAQKVSYAPDPDSLFPAAYSGELVVETTDGRTLRHREAINRGAEQRPLTNGEIAAKFEENAALALDDARVREVRDAVLNLDLMDEVTALTEVLGNG